jgi:hypothetical protein
MGVEKRGEIKETFIRRSKKAIAVSAGGLILATGGEIFGAQAAAVEPQKAAYSHVQLEKTHPREDRRHQILSSEKAEAKKFFGHTIKIPLPPKSLIHTLKIAEKKGYDKFEAHYLPKITMKRDAKYPGWKSKPNKWLWYNTEQ